MSDIQPVPDGDEPMRSDVAEDELREVPDQDVAPESPTPEPPG